MLEPTADHNGPQIERVPCYPPLLQDMVDRRYFDDEERSSLNFIIEIPLSELAEWDNVQGGDLATRATSNTLRYHALFCAVIDELLENNFQRQRRGRNRRRSGSQAHSLRDARDRLQEQRLNMHRQSQQQQQDANNGANDGGVAGDAAVNGNNPGNSIAGALHGFPDLLNRNYELRILPLGRNGRLYPFKLKIKGDSRSQEQVLPQAARPLVPDISLRHVRAKSMGHLVSIKGMVVRSSDVKPFLQVGVYVCDVCGAEIYQETHNKREFLPLKVCTVCAGGGNNNNGAPGRRAAAMGILQLQTKDSKFTKFQEIKLQELPSQVPMGHIPRSLSVYCRGELTRKANPGDVLTVDGIFLPQKVNDGQGFRGRRAGLMSTLYVDAQNAVVQKKSYDESGSNGMTEEETARLKADVIRISMAEDPVGILSKSIAPEIFGHSDIKRALLLQLTGGVFRKMGDGMKIRGDINVCLMGDPGVAKSQLLKHVASVAPRGVYTTGKGSSGVGLTAAITKDSMTGELALEGGALVLADRGICAIVSFVL